jgi:hypothetical protein
MDIQERRNEALNKLTELKRDRGEAVTVGKDYDQSEIAKLEIELESLADAEAAEVRKERETLSLKRDVERDKLQGALKVLESTRLAVIQDMNIATRTVAEKMSQLLATTRQMADTAHALTNDTSPVALLQQNTVSRFGSRIAAIMANIPGHRNRLGSIEWRGASLYTAADNWRMAEEKLLEDFLQQTIEGKVNG